MGGRVGGHSIHEIPAINGTHQRATADRYDDKAQMLMRTSSPPLAIRAKSSPPATHTRLSVSASSGEVRPPEKAQNQTASASWRSGASTTGSRKGRSPSSAPTTPWHPSRQAEDDEGRHHPRTRQGRLWLSQTSAAGARWSKTSLP